MADELILRLEESDEEVEMSVSSVIGKARKEMKRGDIGDSDMDKQLKYLLSRENLSQIEIKKTLNLIEFREKYREEYGNEVKSRSKKTRSKKIYSKVPKNLRERECKELADDESANRRRVLGYLDVKTPRACELNIGKEDFKRLSAAVHLWSFRVKGSLTWLRNNILTLEDIKEILAFAGPGTSWNILKGRSAGTYMKMWNNTKKKAVYYCGNDQTGA